MAVRAVDDDAARAALRAPSGGRSAPFRDWPIARVAVTLDADRSAGTRQIRFGHDFISARKSKWAFKSALEQARSSCGLRGRVRLSLTGANADHRMHFPQLVHNFALALASALGATIRPANSLPTARFARAARRSEVRSGQALVLAGRRQLRRFMRYVIGSTPS